MNASPIATIWRRFAHESDGDLALRFQDLALLFMTKDPISSRDLEQAKSAIDQALYLKKQGEIEMKKTGIP